MGAAALGVALLVATAWHLLRPAVPPAPQPANVSLTAPGALTGPTAAAAHVAHVTHVTHVTVARPQPTGRAHERRPKAANRGPSVARHVAARGHEPVIAAVPVGAIRPIQRYASSSVRPPTVRPPAVPRSVGRHESTRAAVHASRTVAFVRKQKRQARSRHRYGRFVAPLNYNPLPALVTVPAQAPALDIAPESLPTPCTSRRHCR